MPWTLPWAAQEAGGEAAFSLPDVADEDLQDWLAAWPDEPLDLFEGVTPREAVQRHDAGAAVEMLVRYLGHDAAHRGTDLDWFGQRMELRLKKQ